MKNTFYELKTPYEDDLEDIPWNIYPRPQLKRDSFFCLNGEWDFTTNTSEKCNTYSEKIKVPFPPESRLSGVCREIEAGEFMHYRRFFTLPDGFMKDRLILHFGAVDQICSVFINGDLVTDHEGGYIPFSADITELVKIGEENEIRVTAKDDLLHDYPYGKQKRNRGGMWYTPVSGIWQTVWLESVCNGYVTDLKITPSLANVKIRVASKTQKKTVFIKATGEKFDFDGEEFIYSPREAHLWSPEDPYLYDFTVTAGEDSIASYFALREIGCAKIDGIYRVTLNGKPYLFNGLLDQGYFPDGIFLPATPKGFEDDVLLAKRLGFNMLRKHIKIEPLIFYHLCDKFGIAVFQDAVNNSDYSFLRDTVIPTVGIKRISDKNLHKSERTREIFRSELAKMQTHLYNIPSILVYTIFNEGWGQFSADENYALAAANDPTRLYDATSGWFKQSKSDFQSEHIYFKPLKIRRTEERPVFISEFGGYSHRVDGHLFSSANYGYKTFLDRGEYEDALIRLYESEVLPLTKRCVSALVYTQLSDVEDETNGLVTYDRRVVKVDEKRFSALMHKIKESITQ